MQDLMDIIVKDHGLPGQPRTNQPEVPQKMDPGQELKGYFVGFQPAPEGAANRWVIEHPETGLKVVVPIWDGVYPKENGNGLEGTLIALRCENGRTYQDMWTGDEKQLRTFRIIALGVEEPVAAS